MVKIFRLRIDDKCVDSQTDLLSVCSTLVSHSLSLVTCTMGHNVAHTAPQGQVLEYCSASDRICNLDGNILCQSEM